MTLARPRLLVAVCAMIPLLVWLPEPASVAQEEGKGFWAANGRTSFRLYCASCHGMDGQGGGNVAKFLTVEPADLTRIAERYDEWPEELLYEIIDGRQEVKTHGRREMPIWGDVFQSPLADNLETGEEAEERADRKIQELLIFLKTLQVEDD